MDRERDRDGTLRCVDLTLPTPEENLALDEALLDLCETGHAAGFLRFWESPRRFVVLGYGNRTNSEVRLDICRRDDVAVLRRSSGGGAVVQGAGCLNFGLVLPIVPETPSATIPGANAWIMARHAEALTSVFGQEVQVRGVSDLTIGDLKLSGNAQRRKKRFFLFHGTVLHDFDIPLIERLLPMPARQPDYRRNRPHEAFVRNTQGEQHRIKEALREAWGATEDFGEIPMPEVSRLARERYGAEEWSFQL